MLKSFKFKWNSFAIWKKYTAMNVWAGILNFWIVWKISCLARKALNDGFGRPRPPRISEMIRKVRRKIITGVNVYYYRRRASNFTIDLSKRKESGLVNTEKREIGFCSTPIFSLKKKMCERARVHVKDHPFPICQIFIFKWLFLFLKLKTSF